VNKLLLLIPVAMLPGCAAPLLVATGLSATSLAVNETTGRTVSDHVVSTVKGKDCRIVRSLNGNDMCQEEVKLQVTESQYRPSRIADIESRYR
jgi:uncharacterized lipoprotein YajG